MNMLQRLKTVGYKLFAPVTYVNSVVGSLIEWAVVQAKTTAQKLFVVTLMFLIVLWVSLFSYASFYHFYIPSAEISKPVYLSFSVCPEGTGVCSFPSANVSFGKSSNTEEILGSGQRYRVILELEMPDCPINQDLGMFMVAIKMYDRHHYVSAESRRPVIPKYRSFPFRVLDMLMWSPLYFFGFSEEKNLLSVELFSDYIDDYYHPSVGANIEVQSHKIQFYSTRIKLFASFTGLRYILYHWPITSAFFGIWWNMFICVLYIAYTGHKKRSTFLLITQALKVERENEEQNSGFGDLSLLCDDIETEADSDKLNQSTQTKDSLEDDTDTYNLPLVQEPVDFVQDDDDTELMAELRHRRVQ